MYLTNSLNRKKSKVSLHGPELNTNHNKVLDDCNSFPSNQICELGTTVSRPFASNVTNCFSLKYIINLQRFDENIFIYQIELISNLADLLFSPR